MRLLQLSIGGELTITNDLLEEIPPYAILSHTWSTNADDEVNFSDIESGCGESKAGYAKLLFCGKRARQDGIEYFWVDTCCINKANHAELSEAITSMFRWYRDAEKCYVYLSDVSKGDHSDDNHGLWESSFRMSRWFTRGWTLQELLAPRSVDFFSREEELLGDKKMLEQVIHEITKIPITALRGSSLSYFSVADRLRWAANRSTKRKEDKAYCLLGIFDIFLPLIYGEGDNAFIRLQEELDKRYNDQKSGAKNTTLIKLMTKLTSKESSKPTLHKHWLIPRTANTMFTGRESLLQDLEKTVRDTMGHPQPQMQYRIVISGIGGQGKSELSLQLARRLRQMFWGVFWIDVSTTNLAEKSFLEIAEQVSRAVQTWEQACLTIANLQHPWLLVLDNADDPDVDYQHYFPDSSLGVVILTSRNEECQQYATIQAVSLEGLSKEEARDLLLKATRVPQDQWSTLEREAGTVVDLLQSHPLALIQAAAYVLGGHCTLTDYPSMYERQRRRLLTFRPRQAQSRYRDVYATFEASVDVLKTSGSEAAQDALRLLPILAVGAPSQFPLSLFEAAWKSAKKVPLEMDDNAEDDKVLLLTPWHVAHLPSILDTTAQAWDQFRLVQAVDLLKSLALVSTHSHDGLLSLSMHPLIHAWLRDRQDDTEQHENWLRLGCVMAFGLKMKGSMQARRKWLQSHIEALTSWEVTEMFAAESTVLVARVLVECGWALRELRADASLSMLIQKIFMHLALDRFQASQDWLGLYNLTARNLRDRGKIKDGVTLLEQIVRIREQTQAEDHPRRVASQYELATAYRANGQVKQAVTLLDQVVKITRQAHAEDHPDRLSSEHALAKAYRANGQVEQAIALMEQVVKIREQIQAEDHPDRLTSQHELASAYRANGQVKQAVALLEQVVKITEQTHAEDHPDRLASEHALAKAYKANGQVEQAITLLEQVVKVRELLSEDHPDRLASQNELASAYRANGQVKQAVAIQEKVVKITQQTHAKDHPNRLLSQYNLAVMYWDIGRREDALQMIKNVVEVQRRTLDQNHPRRINSEVLLEQFEKELHVEENSTGAESADVTS